MKQSLSWCITVLMGAGLCFGSFPLALALPIVESRTGDPVVRPQSNNTGHSGNPNMGTDYESSALKPQPIEPLKEEINSLRGIIEEQGHQLEAQIQALKKSQQAFYVDLDKRLTQLELPAGALPKDNGSTSTQITDEKSAAPVKTLKSKALATVITTPPTPSVVTKPKATATTSDVLPEAEGAEALVPTVTSTTTEKACYEAASAHLTAKHYAEAIEGFQDCVTRYPQGSYAAQCYYWLGESYMAEWGSSRKDDKTLLDKASQSFLMVTTRFPTHQRATDALLKLGMVEQEKGNLEVSKRYFQQVRDRYPDSAAARMAETYLQEE